MRITSVMLLFVGLAAAPPLQAYVFGWPFVDEDAMAVRGGTTRGAPVDLETTPSDAWLALQAAPGNQDKDRAAILAMAGDYRTSFDFLETVVFAAEPKPARPYRSWGTERIYVVTDEPDFISLQHILVMVYVDDQGQRRGPVIQKHWRQDWRYQPREVLDYLGGGRWQMRRTGRAERHGAWSQSVYQVDDSPRYGSLGRWRHGPEHSIWEGDRTLRPLPRRESSVRSDYDALEGSNRVTILPAGWVHEQDNLKVVLAGHARRDLAREIGLDRYERIAGFDFSPADAYWRRTGAYWALVRGAWAARLANGPVSIADRCAGQPLFAALFEQADRGAVGDDQHAAIERVLDCVTNSK